MKSLEDRFHEGYAKASKRECWLWLKGTSNGRPVIREGVKCHFAFNLAYLYAWGKIPSREYVKQTCGNRLCVNPEHLIAILPSEDARLTTKRGEANPRSKANEDTVRKIREMRKAGHVYKAIKQAVGLSDRAIRNIIKGVTWGHVA